MPQRGHAPTSPAQRDLATYKHTLKSLVRRVHASEPHDLIMKLLGKKYPDTIEEFEASNLPEPFDHELAGVSRGLLRCACAGYL